MNIVFLSVCSPRIPYILVQILNSQFLTFQDGRSKKTKVSYNLKPRGVDLDVDLDHTKPKWV